MKITKRGNYTTRDGRKVRIYAVDGEKEYPIHGAIKIRNAWHSEAWCKDGSCFSTEDEDCCDLIPAPKRKRGRGK